MSWIDTIPEGEAEGQLAELYARVVDPMTGQLDNIMQVHSLHPAGLAAHEMLYRTVMSGTASFRKVDRELVALVVSQVNGCHY